MSKNQMIKGGGYVVVGNNVDDNDDNVDDDRVSKEKNPERVIYLTCFRYLMVK